MTVLDQRRSCSPLPPRRRGRSQAVRRYAAHATALAVLCVVLALPATGLERRGAAPREGTGSPTAVVALLAAPGSPSALYAGTVGAGVLRSTDGGEHWEERSAGLPDGSTVLALAAHPADPRRLYAGTLEHGLFTSPDGGRTWHRTALAADGVRSLAVHPLDPSVIVAATLGSGVFARSQQGWRRVASEVETAPSLVAADAGDRNAAWLGTWNDGVWRTGTGADPAQRSLSDAAVLSLVVDPFDPSTLYAGTLRAGILRSADAGTTWTAASSGLPPFSSVTALAADPRHPGVLYAGTEGGVFRTANGGRHWSEAGDGAGGVFVHALVVDPHLPFTAYAGTVRRGVLVTRDGGERWAAHGAGLPPRAGIDVLRRLGDAVHRLDPLAALGRHVRQDPLRPHLGIDGVAERSGIARRSAGTTTTVAGQRVAPLIITELDVNTSGHPDEGEFVEILNAGVTGVDVGDHQLVHLAYNWFSLGVVRRLRLPSHRLAPGDVLTVCTDGAASGCDVGGLFPLNDANGMLALVHNPTGDPSQDVLVDSMAYLQFYARGLPEGPGGEPWITGDLLMVPDGRSWLDSDPGTSYARVCAGSGPRDTGDSATDFHLTAATPGVDACRGPAPTVPEAQFSFSARGEPDLGCAAPDTDLDARAKCRADDSSRWHRIEDTSPVGAAPTLSIPRLRTRFVTPAPDTPVRVRLQAEMRGPGGFLFVSPRFLGEASGVATPPTISLSSPCCDATAAVRSMAFTTTIDEPGIHTLDVTGHVIDTVELRDVSLVVDVPRLAAGDVLVTESPLDLRIEEEDAWQLLAEPVFDLAEDGRVTVTVAGDVTHDPGRLRLRASIDGEDSLIAPADVVLSQSGERAVLARTFTFVSAELPAGAHTARLEWRFDLAGGGDADAVLANPLVSVFGRSGDAPAGGRALTFATAPDDFQFFQSEYEVIPGLAVEIPLERHGEIVATFSSELLVVTPNTAAEVAPVLDGVVLEESSVTMADADGLGRGAQSWSFILPEVPGRSDAPRRLEVAARVVLDGPLFGSREPDLVLRRSTLAADYKVHAGPDLGRGPAMGQASVKGGTLVEVPVPDREGVVGDRVPHHLLAIHIDPGRTACTPANCPQGVAADDPSLFDHPPLAEDDLRDVLKTGPENVADFLEVMSGGRHRLEAFVEDVGEAELGGAPHYLNTYFRDDAHHEDCAESDYPYLGPQSHLLAEALLAAEFCFECYDHDGDGVLRAEELLIVVVVPQRATPEFGQHIAPGRDFNPLCSEDEEREPFLVHGRRLHSNLAIVYTDLVGTAAVGAFAHEVIGHALLFLDDAYVSGYADSDDDGVLGSAGDAVRPLDTDVGTMSLMGVIAGTSHLDGFHKLALGWVTPRVVTEPGVHAVTLRNVVESGEVLILPRLDAPSREYFLLEVREDSDDTGRSELYDAGIRDSGLAVWHVVEPQPSCLVDNSPQPTSCPTAQEPQCTEAGNWTPVSNYLRSGLRLVQPDLAHVGGTRSAPMVWGGPGARSIGDDPADAVCPGFGNLGQPGTPSLVWTDGPGAWTASGYRLDDITYDASSGEVSFQLTVAE